MYGNQSGVISSLIVKLFIMCSTGMNVQLKRGMWMNYLDGHSIIVCSHSQAAVHRLCSLNHRYWSCLRWKSVSKIDANKIELILSKSGRLIQYVCATFDASLRFRGFWIAREYLLYCS